MAFNVDGLTAYVNENKLELITKTIFGAKSASIMNVQTGIKSVATINILETNAVFQAAACGWSPSGTTTLTQREIEVSSVMVHEALCPKTLEAYYVQTMMGLGAPKDIPFEELYTSKKIAVIQNQLETAIWQGDTDSLNQALARFDGFIKILDDTAGVIDATASTWNSDNSRTIVRDILSKIPAAIYDKPDTVIMMGTDALRTYSLKLASDNNFHFTGELSNMEVYAENSGIKIIGLNGLNGTDRIFAGQLSNFYVGTDMLNEEEEFEIFWADEAREVRFVAEFKMGVNVAFPDQVVSYENT